MRNRASMGSTDVPGSDEIDHLGPPLDRRGRPSTAQLRRDADPSAQRAPVEGSTQLTEIGRDLPTERERWARGDAASERGPQAAPVDLGPEQIEGAAAEAAFGDTGPGAESRQRSRQHQLAQIERDARATRGNLRNLEPRPQPSGAEARIDLIEPKLPIAPPAIDGDVASLDPGDVQLGDPDSPSYPGRCSGPRDLGSDLGLAVELVVEADCLCESPEGNVALHAQRQLGAAVPGTAHLAVHPHRLPLPAQADPPDGNQIGREPALHGDPVDLLAPARRVHAQRVEPARYVEIAGHGPRRDIGASDLDGHVGCRLAYRGVAALDAYASDADPESPDLDVPGQREDTDAGRFRPRHGHVQPKIGGEGGEGDLAAPQARDVDVHVDGRGVDQDAVRRGTGHVEVHQRQP